jgi:hypothetical protein
MTDLKKLREQWAREEEKASESWWANVKRIVRMILFSKLTGGK